MRLPQKSSRTNLHYGQIINISGAIMRRASAELEKRRASLGATRGLRSDGTLDPYYAAILFRDSRGVSCSGQLEQFNQNH